MPLFSIIPFVLLISLGGLLNGSLASANTGAAYFLRLLAKSNPAIPRRLFAGEAAPARAWWDARVGSTYSEDALGQLSKQDADLLLDRLLQQRRLERGLREMRDHPEAREIVARDGESMVRELFAVADMGEISGPTIFGEISPGQMWFRHFGTPSEISFMMGKGAVFQRYLTTGQTPVWAMVWNAFKEEWYRIGLPSTATNSTLTLSGHTRNFKVGEEGVGVLGNRYVLHGHDWRVVFGAKGNAIRRFRVPNGNRVRNIPLSRTDWVFGDSLDNFVHKGSPGLIGDGRFLSVAHDRTRVFGIYLTDGNIILRSWHDGGRLRVGSARSYTFPLRPEVLGGEGSIVMGMRFLDHPHQEIRMLALDYLNPVRGRGTVYFDSRTLIRVRDLGPGF